MVSGIIKLNQKIININRLIPYTALGVFVGLGAFGAAAATIGVPAAAGGLIGLLALGASKAVSAISSFFTKKTDDNSPFEIGDTNERKVLGDQAPPAPPKKISFGQVKKLFSSESPPVREEEGTSNAADPPEEELLTLEIFLPDKTSCKILKIERAILKNNYLSFLETLKDSIKMNIPTLCLKDFDVEAIYSPMDNKMMDEKSTLIQKNDTLESLENETKFNIDETGKLKIAIKNVVEELKQKPSPPPQNMR